MVPEVTVTKFDKGWNVSNWTSEHCGTSRNVVRTSDGKFIVSNPYKLVTIDSVHDTFESAIEAAKSAITKE